jgi:HEAT repeat protein
MKSYVCRLFPAVVLLAASSVSAWPPELPFAVEGGRAELVQELRQLLSLVERGDENAIRALAEGMDTEDGMLGRGIVIVLNDELAEAGAQARLALLAALPSAEPSIRAGILRAAGAIKAEAHRAEAPLQQLLLEDRDSKVRMEAALALGWRARAKLLREPAAVVQSLARALQDPDPGVREGAAVALGDVGPEAAPAVPLLERLLSDKSRKVRLRAAVALGFIGAEAAGAVPTLLQRLKAEPEGDSIRQAIVAALSRIGPAAHEAVPVLIELLRDESSLAGHAALALGLVSGSSEEAIAALLETLRGHELSTVRSQAATALGRREATSDRVLAALRTAAEQDPDTAVRYEAAEALQKLEAGAAP